MKQVSRIRLALSIVLGGLLLAGCATVQERQQTSVPPLRGGPDRIMFASLREGQFDIFMMRPDGTELTRLTSASTDDNFPECSPDGRYFSYIAQSVDPPSSSLTLQMFDGSSSLIVLKDAPVLSSSFSPDGTMMAVALLGVRDSLELADIYTANLVQGGELRKLTDAPSNDGFMPQWSPDGKHIVFSTSRTGYQEIFVMDGDGQNPRQVTSLQEISGEPAWSPDGSKIAFSAGTSTNTQLFTVNVDGTGLRQLTRSTGHNGRPRWSRDGERIVFWSNRSGTEHIYTIRSDGSDELQITSGKWNDENPTWVP